MLSIEHFFFESSIISIADIFWVFLFQEDFFLKKQGCILSISDLNFPNYVVIILADIQRISKTIVNTFNRNFWRKFTFLASNKLLLNQHLIWTFLNFYVTSNLPHMVEFLKICTPGKNRNRKNIFQYTICFISITVHVDLTNFLFEFSLASFTLGSKKVMLTCKNHD